MLPLPSDLQTELVVPAERSHSDMDSFARRQATRWLDSHKVGRVRAPAELTMITSPGRAVLGPGK